MTEQKSRPLQEPDLRSAKATISVGILALAFSLLLSLWAWHLVGSAERERPTDPSVRLPPPESRALIENRLFDEELAGERLHRDERELLSGYAWIDRERKIVRIPIDRAMELLAAEAGR